MRTILITGGMGYIGSHVYLELKDNYEIIIIDKKPDILSLKMTGYIFYQIDLLEKSSLETIFQKHHFHAVFHFAGLKAVGESIKFPLRYYQNNIISTLNLIEIMEKYQCYNLVFSSSATVYGDQTVPYTESMTIGMNLSNPYGQTKYMIEQILKDVSSSNDKWHIVSLRYFNPIGSHPSGLIKEDNNDNLMPIMIKCALSDTPIFVYGTDYDTVDGTCIRDYIHVVDLAKGHVKVLDKIDELCGYHYYNLGTGHGTSVLELINLFQKVNNIKMNVIHASRRPGDIPIMFCSPEKANRDLDWYAKLSLEDMCRYSLNYQSISYPNNIHHSIF